MLEILSNNTGRSVKDLSKDSDRMSYLTPDQAVEYGLIDRVLSSRKDLPTSPGKLIHPFCSQTRFSPL